MASRPFPSDGSRYVIMANGDRAASKSIKYFLDPVGQFPAEVYAERGTDTPDPIDEFVGSATTLDAFGAQVDFRGPTDGRKKVYAQVGADGPIFEVLCKPQPQIDELVAEMATVQTAADAAQDTADAAETPDGAQFKAAAALQGAIQYTDAEIAVVADAVAAAQDTADAAETPDGAQRKASAALSAAVQAAANIAIAKAAEVREDMMGQRGIRYTDYGNVLRFADATLQGKVAAKFPTGIPLVPPAQLVSTSAIAVCYADAKNGLAGNNSQTPATARNTISGAMAYGEFLAPSSGIVVVYVNSLDSDPTTWMRDGVNLAPAAGFTHWILPWPGQARWTAAATRRLTSGWTNTTGTIWSQAVTIVSSAVTLVAVTDMTDPRYPQACNTLLLTRNTSTPTAPARGEFGHSSGTLYVNLPDGSAPGGHQIEYEYTPYVFAKTGAGNIITVGMDAKFYGTLGVNVGNGSGALVNINGTSRYGAVPSGGVVGGAFGMTGSTSTQMLVNVDCIGQRSGNDGFSAAPPNGQLVNAIAVRGEYSHNNDEGTSFHGDSSAYLFDVWSHHNVNGGGCTPVHQSHVEVYGGVYENNHTAGVAAGEGGLCFLDTSTGVIDGGVAVRGENGPGVYVQSTAIVTRGRFRSYGNTAADSYSA